MKKYGTEDIMIHSTIDLGCHPLSVPLVAREMRKAGFSINEIEKVNFYNAYDFYNRRLNLHGKP